MRKIIKRKVTKKKRMWKEVEMYVMEWKGQTSMVDRKEGTGGIEVERER